MSINTISKCTPMPSVEQINDNTNYINLKGFQVLTFNFKVPWPLSLVIDRKSLIKYQMLFRLIFIVKRVERLHTKFLLF